MFIRFGNFGGTRVDIFEISIGDFSIRLRGPIMGYRNNSFEF